MLELGLSGSVRGVCSNEHPYRDPGSTAVHPYPVGNRQQWVDSGQSDAASSSARDVLRPAHLIPLLRNRRTAS